MQVPLDWLRVSRWQPSPSRPTWQVHDVTSVARWLRCPLDSITPVTLTHSIRTLPEVLGELAGTWIAPPSTSLRLPACTSEFADFRNHHVPPTRMLSSNWKRLAEPSLPPGWYTECAMGETLKTDAKEESVAPLTRFPQHSETDRRFREVCEASDRRFWEGRKASDRRYHEALEASDRRYRKCIEASDRRYREALEASGRRHWKDIEVSDRRYRKDIEAADRCYWKDIEAVDRRYRQALEASDRRYRERCKAPDRRFRKN